MYIFISLLYGRCFRVVSFMGDNKNLGGRFLYYSLSHSLKTSHLAFWITSPLFADQYGHSLKFCNLEFDKEPIYDS